MHQELNSIGKERVLKYKGILGIQALYPRKKKLTSIKNIHHKCAPKMPAFIGDPAKFIRIC